MISKPMMLMILFLAGHLGGNGLFYNICSASEPTKPEDENKSEKTFAGSSTIENNPEMLYKVLFQHKRKEQLEVVKTIVSFADFEKQYKMVDILLKKLFEVLTKAKINLESSGYIPGGEFPELETVREALSQLLENTALFGEILLRLPDITHSILKKHKDWLVLAQWTLGFANSTGLYDTKTSELTYLMTQELNMTERDPNYINPYKIHSKKVVQNIPENLKKEEKKKKKPKRGPKLSGSRHGEL